MSAYKRVQQWSTFGRMWYLYDAKWQNPLHSANKIKHYLTGTHKPIYHPLSDCGDHVVVINARDIALPGNEWEKRVYFHHTGYPGGATWTLAWELHQKDPTMIIRKAVYNQLDKNLLRRGRMEKLHLFADDQIPESILQNVSSQLTQLRPTPTRLDHYTEEERLQFPKVFDWPKEHVIR
ncbi:unnamed protein product [Meganyctiphanes norvegica]|uniref:39S ribosomal protein L13, mitochondrial n=1 Tax=Meganyctiphanes norvegica TaxID=48144 RepID=A0AAV2S5Z3_MEGNR